jgi:hypothetical protein
MKKTVTIAILLFSFATSAQTKPNGKMFKKSYKEKVLNKQETEFNEFFDPKNNLYSNYRYGLSFDAPNHWKKDYGVSEHTIFRAFEQDSAISFFINVLEFKDELVEKDEKNIWEIYSEDKIKFDTIFTKTHSKSLKTKIYNFKVTKSYINNNVSLKITFSTITKELDYEYETYYLIHQLYRNNKMISFGLTLPILIFNLDKIYFEELFLKIRLFEEKKINLKNKINE